MGPDRDDVQATEHALGMLLGATTSVVSAAETVADFIVASGCPTPSLYLEVGGRLRCYAVRGYWQTLDGIPPSAGVIGRTFRIGRPSVVDHVAEAPDYLVAITDMTSEVAVPIYPHGEPDAGPIGVLNIEGHEPFPPSTVEWLETCARAFAYRVDQLGGRPTESAQQQLARLTLNISASNDVAAVTQLAAAAAIELSGLSSALVATTSAAGDTYGPDSLPSSQLHTWAVDGPLGTALAKTATDELTEIATYVRGGTSAYTVASAEASGFAGRRAILVAGANRAIFVPMMIPATATDPYGDRLDGLIIVADEQHATLRPDILIGLELLAAHVAICLRTTRAMDALSQRADRDSLTGLQNRAVFHRHVAELIANLATRPRVVVLLIDFDDFKRINDTRGHAAGDDALREISDAMVHCLGTEAALYRVGGDEFAVIATSRAHRRNRANRHVADELVASVRASCTSTISIGVTEVRPGDTVEAVLARCDEGLYEAKRKGRDNWVFTASPSDTTRVGAAESGP